MQEKIRQITRKIMVEEINKLKGDIGICGKESELKYIANILKYDIDKVCRNLINDLNFYGKIV